MNRVFVKHIMLPVLGACAFAAALLFIFPDRRVWVAQFSYCIAPGNDGVPFLGGNKEWAARFCSPSFARDVVAQCRTRSSAKIDEAALFGIVTGATIRVSRGKDGVVCVFSVADASRSVAEEVAKCYLTVMRKAIDDDNRSLARKATSEVAALLSRYEASAKTAQEKYKEAQRTGSGSMEALRSAAEALSSRCAALRREVSEDRDAVSSRKDSLVIIHPLTITARKGLPSDS